MNLSENHTDTPESSEHPRMETKFTDRICHVFDQVNTGLNAVFRETIFTLVYCLGKDKQAVSYLY